MSSGTTREQRNFGGIKMKLTAYIRSRGQLIVGVKVERAREPKEIKQHAQQSTRSSCASCLIDGRLLGACAHVCQVRVCAPPTVLVWCALILPLVECAKRRSTGLFDLAQSVISRRLFV